MNPFDVKAGDKIRVSNPRAAGYGTTLTVVQVGVAPRAVDVDGYEFPLRFPDNWEILGPCDHDSLTHNGSVFNSDRVNFCYKCGVSREEAGE